MCFSSEFHDLVNLLTRICGSRKSIHKNYNLKNNAGMLKFSLEYDNVKSTPCNQIELISVKGKYHTKQFD